MAAYSFGDYIKYSGVCSIIVVALIMKNYGYPSLSEKGKKSSTVTFKMLGYMAEVLIFGMIGVGFFQKENMVWSWQLVLSQFMIVVLSRCIAVAFIIYLFSFCTKSTYSAYQLCFLTFAGFIKGAICYGLM